MSYILEAIRKSEQERAGNDHIPDLNTIHHSTLEDSATKNKYGNWLIVLMGITIIVLLTFQLANHLSSTATTAVAAAPAPSTPTSAPRVSTATATPASTRPATTLPVTTNNIDTSAVTTARAPVQAVAEPADFTATNSTFSSAGNDAMPQTQSPKTEAAKTSSRADIQTLYQQQQNQAQLEALQAPATLKNLPTENQVAKLNQALAQRQTEIVPKTDTKQYQSVFELPESITQQIPTLKFGAHIYSETTGSGFTIINGKKYLPGSEISPGLTLLRIKPNQVIMQFRGYEFSMPAMRDWVKR